MEYYKGEKLKNLGLLPDMVAQQNGDRTVFFFKDQEHSFEEFSRRSSKIASGLSNEGVEPGERVAMYIPNSIQFPETFFGIIKAGAVPVPLNLRMPSRTLSYIIEDSRAKILIASPIETSSSNPEAAKELKKSTCIEKLVLPGGEGEETIDYNRLVEESNPAFRHTNRKYNDTILQMYTSGTTGKPKGVLLTNENLLSSVESVGSTLMINPSSRSLLIPPLYHIYSVVAMSTLIAWDASIVLQAKVDIEKIMKNLEKRNCTVFIGVPALFRMMWLVYNQDPKKYPLDKTLKQVICAGAPLDETTRKKIKDGWKVRFGEGWGMTETTSCGCLRAGRAPKKAGCIGWPMPNVEMKLVNPETRETIVPWNSISSWGELEDEHINAEGEMAIRGPVVFKEYFDLPEKNEEVFDDEGWFYTGDYMRIDEDKALWMVDRTDDMILSGGEKVYPSEVEDALLENSEISEAAVVPAPHKIKGEAPVAFVVASNPDLSEEEIKEFALERVPTYAHPRRIFFKDSLPKSGTLKIQHFKLEEEAEELISEPLGEV